MKRPVQKSLEAIEMWFLTIILRIQWAAKLAYRECLTKGHEERNLIISIRK